jgi:hypothetical protein
MHPFGNNTGITRRDALALTAGLGLSFALPGLTARAANSRGVERPKSFILLWMGGGQSQLDSWDPHPGTSIGGDVQAIDTRLPGVRIANSFPRMADKLDSLCLIRSMVSKEGDHERGTYLLSTGYRPQPAIIHPSLGAILAHELPDAAVQIPGYVSIVETPHPPRGGYLGNQFDAFQLNDPKSELHNVTMKATPERQQRRLQMLDVVEKTFRRGRGRGVDATLHRNTVQNALTMMSSEQLAAFRIMEESIETRAAYGDTAFGLGCLMARRLVEVGVRAIQVNLNGFDTHANNESGQKVQADILDPALAALINDLQQRDLFESTVVLLISEFGRTPNINPFGGRDHWPTGFSALVGGGGFHRGLVIGETDPAGKTIDPKDPVEVADLYATVLKSLGVTWNREVSTPVGRPMKLCEGKPLDRLLA